MSQYYKGIRSRNIYDPEDSKPFKISRSKLELFVECPRCFYIDRRLGLGRPPGFPFNLNSAVDALLKNEFDLYRAQNKPHPLMMEYGIDAVPAQHEMLDIWRENFKGIETFHERTGLILSGAIDDLWISSAGEYIVADYKATSKSERIIALNKAWQDGYKRQMEIYQWLLRRNGLPVSSMGYFVYCNGDADKEWFDNKLEFEVTLIAHNGKDDWVENAILAAHECLKADSIPEADADCDYCRYTADLDFLLKQAGSKKNASETGKPGTGCLWCS